MNTEQQLRFERKHEVLARLNLSKSSFHNRINNGLWVPPISLGDRAVGFLKHETDQILASYIRGASNDEIKVLVISLVAARQNILEASWIRF
jgi:prophage regulatory protein